MVGDLLLVDEGEGLAQVHVEDVQGVVCHHVRMEQRPVRSPGHEEYEKLRK